MQRLSTHSVQQITQQYAQRYAREGSFSWRLLLERMGRLMTTHSSSPHPTIGVTRTISLTRVVAMGSSITIGLGIFVLVGTFLQYAGIQTPSAYLIAMLVFLPIILSYAEQALVAPSSGIYELIRDGGHSKRTYVGGWILIGGNLALIALIGWGAALYVNVTMYRLLGVSVNAHWLAPMMVMLVTVNDLLGTRGRWKLRIIVVYGSILLLLFISVRSLWLFPTPHMPEIFVLTHDGDSIRLVHMIALMAASLWSVNFVLDKRDEMRNPRRQMIPALLLPLILSGSIGILVTNAMLNSSDSLLTNATPLAELAVYVSSEGQIVLEATCVTLGLLICVIALDKTLVTMIRLTGNMVRDGFFPEWFLKISPVLGTPLAALYLFAVLSAVTAAFVPRFILIGFVAFAFLATTVLINVNEVFGVSQRKPTARTFRLPFHPLIPGLSLLISIFLIVYLPALALAAGAGWLLLGFLHYLQYARRGNINVRRRESVVSKTIIEESTTTYTVLVSTANPETAPSLIRAGALLARANEGRVLVLNVALFPDQVPPHIQRQSAEQQWLRLNLLVRRVGIQDVPIDVLVRLAQNPQDGIIEAAQEEHVDMVLLGWEGNHTQNEFDLDPVLDPVVRAAACDVIILRGELPQTINHILVPTEGSPNSIAAMKLAQKLVQDTAKPHIVALNLVEEYFSPGRVEEAEKLLQNEIDRALVQNPPVDLLVLPAQNIRDGILDVCANFDLLILGASRGGVLDHAIFGGLPVELARESSKPALLVKHYEGARRFWLRRTWETISATFPTLTTSEQHGIYQDLYRAAHPSIDFFILIALSAIISMFGLLQNSPAVIIGAMLVAPLMSPIISIAMSIVQGNPRLLRLSAGSTIQGIVLAIAVAVAVTFLFPAAIITSEIQARTQPNLLDLLVALASGAAGGYALGRKEVAAALPGVAIAAALVPPLAVVGYGTATAQLEVVGGALLLFTTNLIAIVFAAIVVFLLLGFRPLQTSHHANVRTGFFGTMLALLIISIPLGMLYIDAVGQVKQQNKIEMALSMEADSEKMRVTDVVVERQSDNKFLVHATVYSLDEVTQEQLQAIEQRLSMHVQAPVKLHATVLRAVLLPEVDNVFVPTPTPGW